MSNNFCRFLSNGRSIQIENKELVVKPCCWYKSTGIKIDDNFGKNFSTVSSILTWTNGCKVCYDQEQIGQKSFRQSSFDIISDANDNSVIALDINIDKTCNAACVMCGPNESTYWSKQLLKHKKIKTDLGVNVNSYISFILKNFDLSNLRRIKFFGGEPLLTDTHVQFLKAIPYPNNVDIWYTSNASVMPNNETLDIWSKFHLVYFESSIDGIGAQFDYIRWPLKWKKVETNLLQLKEICPVNVLFRINHTLNPFNIFYYDRLENWITNNLITNRLGDETEVNVHPCWGAWGLEKTPVTLRNEIKKKYKKHLIIDMISSLPEDNSNSILDFVTTWDPIRQTDWKAIFPEIVDHFR